MRSRGSSSRAPRSRCVAPHRSARPQCPTAVPDSAATQTGTRQLGVSSSFSAGLFVTPQWLTAVPESATVSDLPCGRSGACAYTHARAHILAAVSAVSAARMCVKIRFLCHESTVASACFAVLGPSRGMNYWRVVEKL